MRQLYKTLLIAMFATVAGLSTIVAHGGSRLPVLMQLDYIKDGEHLPAKVSAIQGDYLSPHQGQPLDRIAIYPGITIESTQRPVERMVSFFQGVNEQRVRVFVVLVRYYRTDEGLWGPRFQLFQEPILVRDGKRWKPANTPLGTDTLVVQTGTSLPNAEGYFPSLQLGLTTGSLMIDSWTVQ